MLRQGQDLIGSHVEKPGCSGHAHAYPPSDWRDKADQRAKSHESQLAHRKFLRLRTLFGF